jgi:hypothetical protein
MKKMLLLFLLFFSLPALSQEESAYTFVPMKSVAVIPEKEALQKIEGNIDLETENLIITDWIDIYNTRQKALLYKKDTQYYIYYLPNDFGNFSLFDLTENSKYIVYSTDYHHAARGHTEAMGQTCIIDLEELSVLSLSTFLAYENWDDETEIATDSFLCLSFITFNGNTVSVSTETTGVDEYFNEECLPEGKYEITGAKLVPVK